MKSTSQGISSSRIRSERKNTAPFRTPISTQVLTGVVPRDLGRELANPAREILGRDEDLPDRVVFVHLPLSLWGHAERAAWVGRPRWLPLAAAASARSAGPRH